jgi:hypothetical protein
LLFPHILCHFFSIIGSPHLYQLGICWCFSILFMKMQGVPVVPYSHFPISNVYFWSFYLFKCFRNIMLVIMGSEGTTRRWERRREG